MSLGFELIGYDVRLDGSTYIEDRWSANDREFLLKPKTPWPLSVDKKVWPSYFSEPDLTRQEKSYLADRIITQLPAYPRFLGLHLWARLGDMLEAYAIHKKDVESLGIVVAITLDMTYKERPHTQWDAVLDPAVNPKHIVERWSFLGYDVGNQFLESALSSFYIPPEEKTTLRNKWAPKLNRFGLFQNDQDAFEYREGSNTTFSAYTPPFFVYGLYRIPL